MKNRINEIDSLNAILESLENERNRIGREIHDELGPMLSLIRLTIDSIHEDYNDNQDDDISERLQKLRENIETVTILLRNISHRLVPKLLDEFGLNVAINDFVHQLNNTKRTNIEFYTNLESHHRFENEIEINLFRCCQELLNNAVKHSNANQILIQLILHEKSIVLSVEDDGKGFDAKLINESSGIGLINVNTRVKLLNGILIMDSKVDKGSLITIEVAL